MGSPCTIFQFPLHLHCNNVFYWHVSFDIYHVQEFFLKFLLGLRHFLSPLFPPPSPPPPQIKCMPLTNHHKRQSVKIMQFKKYKPYEQTSIENTLSFWSSLSTSIEGFNRSHTFVEKCRVISVLSGLLTGLSVTLWAGYLNEV